MMDLPPNKMPSLLRAAAVTSAVGLVGTYIVMAQRQADARRANAPQPNIPAILASSSKNGTLSFPPSNLPLSFLPEPYQAAPSLASPTTLRIDHLSVSLPHDMQLEPRPLTVMSTTKSVPIDPLVLWPPEASATFGAQPVFIAPGSKSYVGGTVLSQGLLQRSSTPAPSPTPASR